MFISIILCRYQSFCLKPLDVPNYGLVSLVNLELLLTPRLLERRYRLIGRSLPHIFILALNWALQSLEL